MKILAKFIGTDSLGYEHGKDYTLFLYKDYIKREDGDGICRYSNTVKFLENWTIISKL